MSFVENMVEELTKGEMFPEERDDLMELVRAVDWIADWSKEAGRILNSIPFEKAPEQIKTETLNMVKADVDCVIVLTKAIKILPKDSAQALSLADEVEMLEETVDDIYGEARNTLRYIGVPRVQYRQLDSVERVLRRGGNNSGLV